MIKTMIVMEDDFRRGDEKVYVYSGHFNEIGDDADKIRHLGWVSRQYYPGKKMSAVRIKVGILFVKFRTRGAVIRVTAFKCAFLY